jgi:hypothetical protein
VPETACELDEWKSEKIPFNLTPLIDDDCCHERLDPYPARFIPERLGRDGPLNGLHQRYPPLDAGVRDRAKRDVAENVMARDFMGEHRPNYFGLASSRGE